MYAPFRRAILNVDFYDDLKFFVVAVRSKSTDLHRYSSRAEKDVNKEKRIG